MLGVILVISGILSAAAVVLCLAFYAGMIEVFSLRITNKWYGAVVQALSPGSRLLDIGCGFSGVRSFSELASGLSFATVIGTVRILLAMEVKVVGLEENGERFKKAGATMQRAELRRSMVMHNKGICDPSLKQVFTEVNRFNAVCFSSPLMSLPDPVAELRAAASFLKEGGVVYIPHVWNSSPSMTSRILSPIFKYLHIVPIAEVQNIAMQADMEVIDDLPAVGVDEKDKKSQAARVLVLQRCTTAHLNKGAPSDGSTRSRKNVEQKNVESEL